MVIDTSALVAIIAEEPEADRFLSAIRHAPARRLAATCTVELTIVLSEKKREQAIAKLDALLTRMDVVIEPVTAEQARLARAAFRTYGKGRHKARLNFGDTFSYALAKAMGEPLLFKGNDFSQTDITPAV